MPENAGDLHIPADAGKVNRITTVQRAPPLLESRALQNAVFEHAGLWVIATDETGIIQVFNVGAERLLGYSTDEVVNKTHLLELHDSQEVAARARALSREFSTAIAPGFGTLTFKASRGIEDRCNLTYFCKDGARLPASVSIAALRDDRGTINGYLLIGTDESVRNQIELKLDKAVSDATIAKLAAADFLSNISHELRTPLNAILGFAQLMASSLPPATPSQKRNIELILQAGWHQLELINEMLDLALIESGKLSLSVEPVSLAELMLQCQVMIAPQAEIHGVDVVFPMIETPDFVSADRIRVGQVLIYLLTHAIKRCRAGGAVVVDHDTRNPQCVRISIKDGAAGLSADHLAPTFHPHDPLGTNASAAEADDIRLILSRRLVELMGGTIGVDRSEGTAGVLWFELNRKADPVGGPIRRILLSAVDALHGVQVARTLDFAEGPARNVSNEKIT